jgi:hypothetical protein
MAKRPPFYHIPGGGPPSPLRDAQIKQLTPKTPAAATTTRPAITPIIPAAVAAASYTASAPLQLIGPAFSLPAATGAGAGYLTQSDWMAFSAKEPALGNPGASGQVLASTIAGARSWVSLPIVPSFADSETPAGTINGTNAAFTLAHSPAAGSIHVYKGASTTTLQRLAPSAYSVAGSTLTFTTAPATGSVLLVDYRY